MGLVPTTKEFLKDLRDLCNQHNIVLIMDEVMSGFRAALNGSQNFYGVYGDLVTFGKVIGGGMPVGAFGGIEEIMSLLSPNGAVYQAGTLSGNPVAMSAGLATLEKLKQNPKIYQNLESLALQLTEGLQNIAQEFSIPLQVCVRGSMFGFFFNENPVNNFKDAQKSDTEMFAKFHQGMLQKGIYLAPSQFESGFICSCMDEDLIQSVLERARQVILEISNYER